MRAPVAGRAEGHEVGRVVAPAGRQRHDVTHSRPPAAARLLPRGATGRPAAPASPMNGLRPPYPSGRYRCSRSAASIRSRRRGCRCCRRARSGRRRQNAGIGVPAPLELQPMADFRRQLEVNLVGPVAMIQAFLPLIRRGGRSDRQRRVDRGDARPGAQRRVQRVEVRDAGDRPTCPAAIAYTAGPTGNIAIKIASPTRQPPNAAPPLGSGACGTRGRLPLTESPRPDPPGPYPARLVETPSLKVVGEVDGL